MAISSREIKGYDKGATGETPILIDLLLKYNENLAKEQMREADALYLGRRNLSQKMLSLIALSVSLALGDRDSLSSHFKLAKKYNVERNEIIDIIKISKLVLMSSTMYGCKECLLIIKENARLDYKKEEIDKIIKKVRKDINTGLIPENFIALSEFSFDLLTEHLKEKGELLSPMKLDMRTTYLIAFSVAQSIKYKECMRIYLKQFFGNGGTIGELEDAISTVRYVTGNRVMNSAVEILKDLDSLKED